MEKIIFTIEDEVHAEVQGEYTTFEEALLELKKRRQIRWDEKPNVCPCTSWKTCGREYEIVKYDTSTNPWKKLEGTLVLEISAKETKWLLESM